MKIKFKTKNDDDSLIFFRFFIFYFILFFFNMYIYTIKMQEILGNLDQQLVREAGKNNFLLLGDVKSFFNPLVTRKRTLFFFFFKFDPKRFLKIVIYVIN